MRGEISAWVQRCSVGECREEDSSVYVIMLCKCDISHRIILTGYPPAHHSGYFRHIEGLSRKSDLLLPGFTDSCDELREVSEVRNVMTATV